MGKKRSTWYHGKAASRKSRSAAPDDVDWLEHRRREVCRKIIGNKGVTRPDVELLEFFNDWDLLLDTRGRALWCLQKGTGFAAERASRRSASASDAVQVIWAVTRVFEHLLGRYEPWRQDRARARPGPVFRGLLTRSRRIAEY